MVETKSLNLSRPIYILAYHPWLDGFEKYFVPHLSWLRENGFETISLESLIQYLRGEEVSIPERPVVITFDDGTIENYTVVYPLFKEYGFVGTVFAPTANKFIKMSGTDWWKDVESQGILKTEGHSHTHALTFVNDHVEDFYTGEKQNLGAPIIKGLEERYGAPIFGLGYELVSRRFIPRMDLIEICVDYVREQGGITFFEKEGWKEDLFALVSKYKGNRGRYETEEEKGERIGNELELSKTIIEKAVGNGKRVRFFAYPFGAHDSDLVQYLKKLGYVGAFTTDAGGNHVGDDPFLIKRMVILEENSFGGLPRIFREY